MPQPPQTPPQPPVVLQQQQQQQQQAAPINLSQENGASSVSRSDAENVVSQAGSLNNYQINPSYDQFFAFGSGTRTPSPHNVGADLLVGSQGDLTVRVGWNWNIGGRNSKLAHAEIEAYRYRQDAKMCAQLAVSNLRVDTVMAPQYAVCDAFTVAKAQAQTVNLQQQNMMLELQMKNQQLEEKLYNMMIKLEQMKAEVNQNGGKG